MGSNESIVKDDKLVIIDTQNEQKKKRILKGSYKDRYKVENRDPLLFYDMIINIDSFYKKPENIWKIEARPKKKNQLLNTMKHKTSQKKIKMSKIMKQKKLKRKIKTIKII